MKSGTMAQKKRLMAGILQEYDTFALDDFAIFHSGKSMLCLVIPKMTNQIQDELSRTNRSKCGVYSLLQSVNLILQYCTPFVASQLSFPDADITCNFLKPFDYVTRQIGKCTFNYVTHFSQSYNNWIILANRIRSTIFQLDYIMQAFTRDLFIKTINLLVFHARSSPRPPCCP